MRKFTFAAAVAATMLSAPVAQAQSLMDLLGNVLGGGGGSNTAAWSQMDRLVRMTAENNLMSAGAPDVIAAQAIDTVMSALMSKQNQQSTNGDYSIEVLLSRDNNYPSCAMTEVRIILGREFIQSQASFCSNGQAVVFSPNYSRFNVYSYIRGKGRYSAQPTMGGYQPQGMSRGYQQPGAPVSGGAWRDPDAGAAAPAYQQTSNQTSNAAPATMFAGKVTALRIGPGDANGITIAKVPAGAKVSVIGMDQDFPGWAKVEFDGNVGYALIADFKAKPISTGSTSSKPKKTGGASSDVDLSNLQAGKAKSADVDLSNLK